MFTEPKYGWSTFEYGGLKIPCSYLIDVPQTWSKIILAHYQMPDVCGEFILSIDEEGMETYLMFTYSGNYVVRTDRDGVPHVMELNIDVEEFTEDYLRDIEKYMTAWINWYEDLSKDELLSREKSIRSKIKSIRYELMKHYEIAAVV